MIMENRATTVNEMRLEEIVSIIPVAYEDAPEITPEQAAKAHFANIPHPQWLFKTSSEQGNGFHKD